MTYISILLLPIKTNSFYFSIDFIYLVSVAENIKIFLAIINYAECD